MNGKKAVVKPHDDRGVVSNFYRGGETDEQWSSVFGTGVGKTMTLTRLIVEKQDPEPQSMTERLDCSLLEFRFNDETEMRRMIGILEQFAVDEPSVYHNSNDGTFLALVCLRQQDADALAEAFPQTN